MDDDDDPVVEEFPLYLSKNLSENLFLLQYPVKASSATFDDAEVVNCCVKPINQQLKIDYALNTSSKNYDSFKGEQFAISADGKGHNKNEKPSFRSGTMDKQSFISSKPVENTSRYMVCMFHDKEFHGTPVKSILQMRQTFSYFDKEDKRKKAEQKAENEADVEEDELKQVTVKFARTENDKIRKAREKSFNYISQMESEEPWCESFWHKKNSSAAELERLKFFNTNNSPIGDSLNLTSTEYLDTLISKEKIERNIDSLLPNAVICMHKLKDLTLVEQIQVILKDAKVVTFTQLMHLLPDKSLTAEKVLRSLPTAGVLIKGNWVAQSEIIYATSSVSGTNGIPSEFMCNARDYMLFQYTKSDSLDRHKLAIVTQLPAEETKEILCSVARLNADKKWNMLLPPDREFENKYQEIVQRQEMFWRAREEKFNEMEKCPKRVRKKSARDTKFDAKTT